MKKEIRDADDRAQEVKNGWCGVETISYQLTARNTVKAQKLWRVEKYIVQTIFMILGPAALASKAAHVSHIRPSQCRELNCLPKLERFLCYPI